MEEITKTKHHFSSGVYAREMQLPAFHYAITHAHNYDHFSILADGLAMVTTDDRVQTIKAPYCLEIKAGVKHKITALTDTTWFCIHATTETDIKKIDEVLIQNGGE